MQASFQLGAAPGAAGRAADSPWLARQLRLGLVALNLMFATVCAAWLTSAYRAELRELEAQAANTALLTAQNAGARFDMLALGLSAVALQLERQIALGGIDPASLWAIVDEQVAQLPEVHRLGVFDARGAQVCGVPASRCLHLDIADRDYFQQLRQTPQAGVRMFGPHASRVDGRPSLMLARALRTPGGGFAGVAILVMPLPSLRGLVSVPDTGSTGAVSLRSPALQLLVRQPELTASAPNPSPGAVSDRMRAAVSAMPDAGVYRAVAANDGVERIVAYRRVPHYPLYVMVGEGFAERMLGWRRDALGLASLLALVARGRCRTACCRA